MCVLVGKKILVWWIVEIVVCSIMVSDRLNSCVYGCCNVNCVWVVVMIVFDFIVWW